MKNKIGSLLVLATLALMFHANVASAYYDTELGRFIQPDTIIPDLSNPQSYNRYSYVMNNPLRYNDPSGHDPAFSSIGMFQSLSVQQEVAASRAGAPVAVGVMVGTATAGVAAPVLVGAGASAGFAAVGSGIVGGVAGDAAAQGTQMGLGTRRSFSGQEMAVSGLAGGALSGAASKIASLKTTPGAAPEMTPAGTPLTDPGQLRLPPTRAEGADPFKLSKQIGQYGKSTEGMPAIQVTKGANGEMMINDGVTRATRAAMTPGTKVPVQVIENNPAMNLQKLPRVSEKLPGQQ